MKVDALLFALALALALSVKEVSAVGNEEDILIKTIGVTPDDNEQRIFYQCTFRNLWTAERQPVHFPQSLARWDGPIVWTHTLQFQPWRANFGVTRGVEKLVEDGFSDVLQQEMTQQSEQVQAFSEYDDFGFFVNNTDFVHLPPIEASSQYPFLSMMAGMSPSPDWFTGFYSFWLVDEYSRTWYDHLKIQVKPWDAGTDAGVTYMSLDSDLDPPEIAQRITPGNAPEGGELLGPDGTTVPNVGEMECFLVVGDEELILPDCDWFANPCCNETDTTNCGATLPNGALPQISPEYTDTPPEIVDNLGEIDGGMDTAASKLNRLEDIAVEMRQLAAEVESLVLDLRADDSSGSSVAASKRNNEDL